MKKVIAILLIISVVCALAACTAKPVDTQPVDTQPVDTEPTEPIDEPLAGGWTVGSEFGEAQIPADAQEAFDAAMDGFTGVGYTPVAYLGSQVVAGINYAFLCKAVTMTAEPKTDLAVVTVYRDTENVSTIKEIKSLEISEYAGKDEAVDYAPETTVGGWTVTEAVGGALPENAQKALETALDGFEGVGYTPLACLGTQVVAGTNFAILCKSVSTAENSATRLTVVTVYADLTGGAQILASCGFLI